MAIEPVRPRLSAHAHRPSAPTYTIALHKPYGVLPCFTDPEGRSTLADYVELPGVYAAGRLDMDSEGLMLLTSDGTLSHRITDPQHKLPKVYLVQVERIPDEQALRQLRQGVVLSGTKTRPADVRLLDEPPALPDRPVPIRFRKTVPTCWIEMTIREGMNRQVRRMTAAVGHPTLRLVRVAIGPILLGNLAPGVWRELTSGEVQSIQGSETAAGIKPRRQDLPGIFRRSAE
ncbi:pseudouridine synthase [Nitrospira lenta]|uniref:Pseudouridine synthase n=1 Tax=Nitrospira lenta TaxID=1436998 RepID=A0A330LA71_9BACT|nr:pseudouridine synthase [Nitrospira lenta]SPP66645.1 Pseudouridine synthase [Nitrospira lenta]